MRHRLWKPFFTPANHAKAQELNKSIREYAYGLEVEQGKNIADASAQVVDGLDEVVYREYVEQCQEVQ